MEIKLKTKFKDFIIENKSLTKDELTNIIIDNILYYKNKFKRNSKDINNGYCMDFAEKIIDNVGYENDNIHRVYSEYLYDYDNLGFDEEQSFDDENLSKWNKISVEKYGGLPKIEDIESYEPDTHVWIYLCDKHYDAENPYGVDKWYDLKFFKRDIKNYI